MKLKQFCILYRYERRHKYGKYYYRANDTGPLEPGECALYHALDFRWTTDAFTYVELCSELERQLTELLWMSWEF